ISVTAKARNAKKPKAYSFTRIQSVIFRSDRPTNVTGHHVNVTGHPGQETKDSAIHQAIVQEMGKRVTSVKEKWEAGHAVSMELGGSAAYHRTLLVKPNIVPELKSANRHIINRLESGMVGAMLSNHSVCARIQFHYSRKETKGNELPPDHYDLTYWTRRTS